jgi:hypothetical protein
MPLLPEGTKFDGDKIRVELLSPWFLEEVSKVLTSGAIKYDDNNWAKGIRSTRLVGATLRHVFAYMRGEVNDPEWGYHHLAHAACCLMFLVHQDVTGLYGEYSDMPQWSGLPKTGSGPA